MSDFSNYSTKWKYYDNPNKLVTGKMKVLRLKEFVGLKPKIYSYLVDGNGKHKKVKSVSKNVVATISHNEFKNVLFNKKCLRYSVNKIQRKDHRIGVYEINKVFFLCFSGKIYIQNNGCDGIAFGY